MADVSLTTMTPDQLRQEVDRLQRELDQTSSEKIQSAQYGLVLLEEKEQLEMRCDELETLFDTTKNELDVTQEALAKFQSNQQVKICRIVPEFVRVNKLKICRRRIFTFI